MRIKAVVEIPKDTHYKYELNSNGILVLDRVLNQSIPFNYGYIPDTLSEDGDALDIFVLSKSGIPPKTEVEIKVLGVYKCIDKKQQDDKIIACLVGENVKDVHKEIKSYLETYKKGFKVLKYQGKEEAQKVIAKAQKACYNESLRKQLEEYED